MVVGWNSDTVRKVGDVGLHIHLVELDFEQVRRVLVL